MVTKARNTWFDFKKNFLDIYNFFGGNTQSFAYYNKFMNELSQANSLAELENNTNLDNFSKLFVESLKDLELSHSFGNVLQEELKDLKQKLHENELKDNELAQQELEKYALESENKALKQYYESQNPDAMYEQQATQEQRNNSFSQNFLDELKDLSQIYENANTKQEISHQTQNTLTHAENVSQIEEENPKIKETKKEAKENDNANSHEHITSINSLLKFFDKQAENNKNQSLNKKDFIKSFLEHCEKGMNTKEMQVLFLLYHKDPSKLFKEHKDMIEQGLLKALDNPKLLQADPLRSVIKLHLEHNDKLPSYIEKVTHEEKLNLIEHFSKNALDKQILGKNKDAFLNDTDLEKQVTQEIKGNDSNAIGGFNASKEELEWANSILSDKQKPLQTYSLNQAPLKSVQQTGQFNAYTQANKQPVYQSRNHNIGGRDM
ncbi:hypothetical protein [Helicobacter cetorum]|uniref:Uncharacterized protein n=1 Tax=Helicobacter cetorum (strain ATCC BAA-540 / CCUG 52418 / MIT 99-5656) TaxID=1163745 RepID=I0EU90_HELCM|nr:hypothetical protein [Helicobacter cetorum]AFI06509.1 hypothetical protein HCD_07610 [Helicobacter cetorum MIT 99-5656]